MRGKIMFKKAVLFIIIIFSFTLFPTLANASPATSYTMTLNSKGRYIRTQDAYLPERSVVELKLNNPQDLYIAIEKDDKGNIINNYMYIADTGNKRIIKYDPYQDVVINEYKLPEFKTPKGVFVTKNEEIYVADSGAEAIFKLNENGEVLNKFVKPTAPTFDERKFSPSKIGVDNRGNMFIYAEGVDFGIIHLSNSGEFLGYFTSNLTDLTFTQRLQNLLFNEEQLAKLFPRIPSTFSNVFVDHNNLVYTTTGNNALYAVKKHNIAGENNFSDGVFSQNNAVDIYVDEQGIIYAGMATGEIFVYTSDGEFIHSFGASNYSSRTRSADDIAGLFNSLSAIAVDGNGMVWALDDSKSFIQSFKPTEYALKIYQALNLYTNRRYQEAIATWQEVLRLNQMSVLAHNNIAKNYLALEEYELAMKHFEIAGNRDDYSEAFWEVRNIILQKNLTSVMIGFAIFAGLVMIAKAINKRKPFMYLVKAKIKEFTEIKQVNNVLYMFRVMRHPLDSFYELKKGKKGSFLGAITIYIGFFFVFLWYTIGKDFIYQYVAIEDLDFNSIVLGFFALTLLFVYCNYLVTSIKDGEGTLKQIFILFAYSLAPLFIACISVVLLSYILTYNEAFFLDLIMLIGGCWSGLNIILGVQEIHNYTTRDTIKSIILTIFFMLIIVILIAIIVIMWEQLINFLKEIVMEAIRNVTE
ncbi:MAG: DUF1282 family protein [Bacilli bacterium]|nr:DUF1282 family protein [Bacilli bacterium]